MEVGNLGKGLAGITRQHGAAGHHLMVPAGEQLQHLHCFGRGMGLAQHPALTDHNGVGGDDHVIAFPADGKGFQPADPAHFIKGGSGGVHGFVNICNSDSKRNTE